MWSFVQDIWTTTRTRAQHWFNVLYHNTILKIIFIEGCWENIAQNILEMASFRNVLFLPYNQEHRNPGWGGNILSVILFGKNLEKAELCRMEATGFRGIMVCLKTIWLFLAPTFRPPTSGPLLKTCTHCPAHPATLNKSPDYWIITLNCFCFAK